jgi:hypothetical protein
MNIRTDNVRLILPTVFEDSFGLSMDATDLGLAMNRELSLVED